MSVAQLIRLISATDTPMRDRTLQTMFPDGDDEPLVRDFKLHPKGRSKMIEIAVERSDLARIRKDPLVNASDYISVVIRDSNSTPHAVNNAVKVGISPRNYTD